MNIKKLYKLKESLLESKSPISDIQIIDELINNLIKEDTSATGGPAGSVSGSSSTGTSISGMGSVVNSQPSQLPGALNGNAWMNNGGSSGSGDVSFPYNPGGGNRMFQ